MIIKRNTVEEIPYTSENVDIYKSENNLLGQAMTGEDISGIMLISKESKELVGYIAWKGDYIVALEVVNKYRKQGYGKKLLERAISSGCRKLCVNKQNYPAIDLYKKFGFRDNKIDYGSKMEMEI